MKPIPPGQGKSDLVPTKLVKLPFIPRIDTQVDIIPGNRAPNLRHYLATGEVQDFHLRDSPGAYLETYPQAYQGDGTAKLKLKDNPTPFTLPPLTWK